MLLMILNYGFCARWKIKRGHWSSDLDTTWVSMERNERLGLLFKEIDIGGKVRDATREAFHYILISEWKGYGWLWLEVGIKPQTPIMKVLQTKFYGKILKEYYPALFWISKNNMEEKEAVNKRILGLWLIRDSTKADISKNHLVFARILILKNHFVWFSRSNWVTS